MPTKYKTIATMTISTMIVAMSTPSRTRRDGPSPRREHSSRPARMLALLLACCVPLPVAAAQARPAAGARGAPVSAPLMPRRDTLPAARVNSAIADYNRWLDEIAAKNDVAGLATAIVVDGKVRYQRTLGYADSATGARVTPATVFRLASLSKAFASA